jgi:hypothetical protein
MRKSRFYILICLSILFLASCHTADYIAATNQCSSEALRQIPIKMEQRSVTRTRQVEVPTGEVRCRSRTVDNYVRTTCKEVTQLVSQDYTAVEDVDSNQPIRDSYTKNCRVKLCTSKYGNSDCRN